mgnify:CR=1 FL=1
MNDNSTTLWRGMNRVQLDAAYDNNAVVPDATQRRDGWIARSAEMRKNNPELLDLAYGPRERNRIDAFRCGKANAPLFCFIHGGYWQRNSKDIFSCMMAGPMAKGFDTAMIGYTLCPDVTLTELVAEIHAAIRYLRKDLDRWATLYDVPLVFPKSLASETLNKAFLFAADHDAAEAFIKAAWARVWGEGADPADAALLAELARQFGWSAEALAAWVASSEAADRYEAGTQAAHEAGVFGMPTMIVGDEMWWGNDRLTFMEKALQTGLQT